MNAWSVRGEAQRRAASDVVAQPHTNRNVSVNRAQDVISDYQTGRLLSALERRVTGRDGTPVLLESLGGSDPRPSQF